MGPAYLNILIVTVGVGIEQGTEGRRGEAGESFVFFSGKPCR